jgi:Rv0078B-related antitoxin
MPMDYTSGDSLYIDEVLRARQMSAAEKLSAGYELFNFACGVTRAGIRHQFPAADDNEIERILVDRLALRDRLEIGKWKPKMK